jgi:hypothetical protein
MSEHPDWRQFKLEEEHMAYIADLFVETEDNPPSLSEEEWKSLIEGYEMMVVDGEQG